MGRVQRSVAIIVTSGMKNPPKKLKISQFLPRFQPLALLFLIKRLELFIDGYILIAIFGNLVRQRVSANLYKLEFRDSDRARGSFVLRLLILWSK